MPSIWRRVGVASLAALTVFTVVSASAASLNITAPSRLGAGEQDISAPCTSVDVTFTTAYSESANAYVVDAVVLNGTGCTGTGLTVKVTEKDGATNPETTTAGVDSADINGSGSGPLTVNVSAKNVKASDLLGIAILIEG